MAAGLGAYAAVLSDPRARAFSAAGLVARLPISMTGLGIVLLVSIETGSFGRAGLVTAVGTVTGALVAPWWGRLIDRVGQARVLLAAAAVNSISLGLLIVTVLADLPLVTTLAAAAGAGVGFSSAGASVRARWSHRLKDSPLLNTAFAVEAVVDEIIFIVGPVLVTFLATGIHPALGVLACIVLGLSGAVALAAMRSTQPPVASADPASRPRGRLAVGLLAPLVLASAALGALFGGMEVAVVAFATEKGVLPYAGFIVMAWAVGSLVAGVVTGAVSWRASPARRFQVGALLLGLSTVPLPFIDSPVLLAVVLTFGGLAIAPTLIASIGVAQSAVPGSRLTEALGWNTMGLAAGVAAGAAGLGGLIDAAGARAGFVALVGVGLAIAVAASAVRPGPVSPAPPDTPAADPRHPGVQSPSR